MQSNLATKQDTTPASQRRVAAERASGFFLRDEAQLDKSELAAAIAMAVHRGLLPQSGRQILPVRG